MTPPAPLPPLPIPRDHHPKPRHPPLAFSTQGLAPACSSTSTKLSCLRDTASCSALFPSRLGHTMCTSAPAAINLCDEGGQGGGGACPLIATHDPRSDIIGEHRLLMSRHIRTIATLARPQERTTSAHCRFPRCVAAIRGVTPEASIKSRYCALLAL